MLQAVVVGGMDSCSKSLWMGLNRKEQIRIDAKGVWYGSVNYVEEFIHCVCVCERQLVQMAATQQKHSHFVILWIFLLRT